MISFSPIYFNGNLSADYHQKESKILTGNDFNLEVAYIENPKTGYLNLEFKILNKTTREPISDIVISIIASLKKEKFITYALNTPSTPNIFKCVFNLESSGDWRFVVDISKDSSVKESFDFNINIEDRNRKTKPFSASFYLFISIFLIIFTIPLFIFRKTIFSKSN